MTALDSASYVNEIAPTTSISNVVSFLRSKNEKNPIDDFQETLRSVIEYGSEGRLVESDLLGKLLLVSLVSAVENYARSLVSSVLSICPISQSKAADKPVIFGAVLWHSGNRFGRSAFEHNSLAEVKGLRATFRDYLGIELSDNEFSQPLRNYERVCQFRHGIVHANGYLPGRNAIKLGHVCRLRTTAI